MSRDFWIVLATALATTISLFVVLKTTGVPDMRQSLNMEQAERRLPEVQAILDADPRLKEVRLGVYTGLNGAVWLLGSVENSAELLALMRGVGELGLPVPICWNIKVWAELEAESGSEMKAGFSHEPHAN